MAPLSARSLSSLAVLLVLAGFVAVGYSYVRRDVETLRVISQDNILWTATQIEVELLRFQTSVAQLEIEQTPEALEAMRVRFDILWSRVLMLSAGRVGELMRRYDRGHDSVPAFADYLNEIDPVIADLAPSDSPALQSILRELETFRHDLRLYTLRVVSGDAAASALARQRIDASAQVITLISLAAVLLGLLAIALILRDNRRQREIAELNRASAAVSEESSRAKSRFLTMMSHEMRNPLNGVLGPLALLGQSDLAPSHQRLVEQARQSGKSMVQMLAGLLDYRELQDGQFSLRVEPFRLATLAERVEADLAQGGASAARVRLRPGGPMLVYGDAERLRQIFVHLTGHALESSEPGSLDIAFGWDAEQVIGDIVFAGKGAAIDWKLALLTGLSDIAPDQVTSDSLRLLIVRGLIAATKGVLTLAETADGRPGIRVAIPAPALRYERIRVRLETRSPALAAIYQAALRSERVVFAGTQDPGPADVVLVDATSVGEEPLMSRLRVRFPDALFVSLGTPDAPHSFDDILESPADLSRLRSRILGRLSV